MGVGDMSGIRTGRLRRLSRTHRSNWVEFSYNKFLDGEGSQGSHCNMRPVENTRTGKLAGTLEYYNY